MSDEVIQLERHVRSQSETSSGRPGMSASAYSTPSCALRLGHRLRCVPRLGRRRAAREFWQLAQVERSRFARNGPTALS